MVRMVCKDVLQGLVVEDGLCLEDTRPDIQIDSCNTNPCPPRLVICFRTFFLHSKIVFCGSIYCKNPFQAIQHSPQILKILKGFILYSV